MKILIAWLFPSEALDCLTYKGSEYIIVATLPFFAEIFDYLLILVVWEGGYSECESTCVGWSVEI